MKAFAFLVFYVLLSCGTETLHAQWVRSGLDSLRINCFAVNAANLFAGSDSGVFLSTNNGTSWTKTSNGLTSIRVNALVASGTNLFAATDGGVRLSTNNGASWTSCGLGHDVHAFAASGTNLFAGAYGNLNPLDAGVYLSTNNGASWAPAGLMAVDINTLAVNGTNVFAGTRTSGVFLSTDNGASWTRVNSGLTVAPGSTDTSVSAFAIMGTNLYASIAGVFRSTNNGTTWTLTGYEASVRAFGVSGTNLFACRHSSMAVLDGGVFLSTDNGTSWTHAGLAGAVNVLAVTSATLFAGTNADGVYRRPLSEMITGVNDAPAPTPSQFTLEQNYPNPFNPVTTISMSVPSHSFVSLKVLDALGREVSVLVAEDLAPGRYTRQWNATGYASGVYFCRVQAGPFTETKKLILLR